MDPFHQRLARTAFDASDDLGLVLAGGYAISAHHLTSRPSRDLDFATMSTLPLDVITDLHRWSRSWADDLRTRIATDDVASQPSARDPDWDSYLDG
ncbi:nucleotidyl transferase AbiEii/AbiGii toxin family protein [Actinoplanes sp. NPDC049599]|uniref:nucleotidyl transferase AbiEii/AbiGii toxin family protein n=1 Tax=Actinoplanes sp. NPDC049599 TaxID=3363903 RepID=UPI00378B790B